MEEQIFTFHAIIHPCFFRVRAETNFRLLMTEELYVPNIQRILMASDTIGGVWTYSLELARALKPYNIEVVLATMGAPLSVEQKAAAARISNISIFESTYKLEWMEDPWQDVYEAGEWLLDLEVLTQPDIIHLNTYSQGQLGFQAPVLVVGHSCVYSWYYAVKHHAPHEAWRQYKIEVTAGLRKAGLVTAPTEAMLGDLRANYGSFNDAGAIYNARRQDEFLPRPKESFILSAGRLWDEAKNISSLGYIAPHLKWPVYVAGEKEDPDGRYIEFGNINWLGRLTTSTLSRYMGRASIFALPARYEPFGLSPLEAALSGCALVLGDIPSLREVWEDAACFVPPDDYEALKWTINELIENEDLRIENAKKVRRRALYFTPEKMAAKYLIAYRELLISKHKAELAKQINSNL